MPALDGSGQRIRVSSTAPVNEPYLNFIVELSLPGGQLLREYTLLLDPPLYQPDLPRCRVPSRKHRPSSARRPWKRRALACCLRSNRARGIASGPATASGPSPSGLQAVLSARTKR